LLHARTLIATILLCSIVQAQKQTTPAAAPPPPQLSPKAAYQDAMHPLEVTRHSIANWSETEIAALKVAVGRAAQECAARDPKAFSGDTLIDLARLCSLGQTWKAVAQIATQYIATDGPKPLLNQAYAAEVDAELHLKDEPAALAAAQAMLRAVPYDGLVAEATNEAIEYMQFANTADAVTLDALREPLLLAGIRAAQAAADAPKAAAPAPDWMPSPPSVHELYSDGLGFAALQQLAGQPEAAQATVATLDAALPASLTPDDALPIAAVRKRYALLGQPLPAFPMQESLVMPNKLPQLPAPHAITALLLFPDWCAQCVRMGRQFPQSVFIIEQQEAYFYGLLVETAPATKPQPAPDGTPAKPTPREVLAETSTVVVPASVLDQFAASDFPFLVIADAHGVVRVAQPVDGDAMLPGSTVDTAIARVGAQWPAVPPKGKEAPAAPDQTPPVP
jgi:hypothetical protein